MDINNSKEEEKQMCSPPSPNNAESQEEIQINSLQANLTEIYSDFEFLLPYEQSHIKPSSNNAKVSCDFVIVIDCTGSMGSWIQRCKDHILNIISDLKKQFAKSELRVGFVGYRDHCDSKRLEVFPFVSQDYESLEAFIYSLSATGGGDIPEDMAGGLNYALNHLDWKSQAKAMVLIADSPCHGSKFHSNQDDYPSGCPKGINIEQLISQIGKSQIDLNVIEISSSTNQMFQIFDTIYKESRGKPINRMPLGTGNVNVDATFAQQISKTVATTITSTSFKGKENNRFQNAFKLLRAHKGLFNTLLLSHTELRDPTEYSIQNTKQATNAIYEAEEESSSENEDEEYNKEKPKFVLEGKGDINKWVQQKEQIIISAPQASKMLKYYPEQFEGIVNWNLDFVASNQVFSFSCTCYTPFVSKSAKIDWNNPQIEIRTLSSKIKIFKKYFAEGAMRFAFFAYDSVLNQKLVAKLHKELKYNSDFNLMKRDSMSLIACHYFAEEFNSRIILKVNSESEVIDQILNCQQTKSVYLNQTPFMLNFVDSTIYEVHHQNPIIKYYFVENFIEGEYEKYNNNAGWTNQTSITQFNDMTQAFSHFTWQYSSGQILVVDIQGGQFGVLTDPQIHTKNRSKLYGAGDLGYEGMLRFFYSHTCNKYCQSLDLIHPKQIAKIPEKFDFFSDLYGLSQLQGINSEKNKENAADLLKSDKEGEQQVEEEEKETEIQIDKEVKEIQVKKGNKKNKKKKWFQELNKQREIERKLKEEEEKLKIEEEEKAKKIAEEKLKELEKQKLEIPTKVEAQLGIQCSYCKKCFFFSKQAYIDKKLAKLEILCNSCEYACQSSMIDLACIKCGSLFKCSGFACKVKKMNLVGKCLKCRN